MEATVVKNAGSHYLLSPLPEWKLFPAVLRGKIRLKGSSITNPIAVGDRVEYILDGDTAVITEVLPRRNYLIRRSTNLSRQAHIIAANLDRAYVVVSLYFPEVKLPFLDRILVTCELYGIPATIVLSKTDMYREMAADELTHFRSIYECAGYPVLETSVRTGEGIEALREACKGHVNLFSGESGVGKSSLIKALDPSLDPKVGAISAAHLQGKHTTSLYEMYPLSSGGYVIDSPGIRGFGLVDVEKEEIARYFPEMLRASEGCRFTPCTHTHEPGCEVRRRFEAGEYSQVRFDAYVALAAEMRESATSLDPDVVL